jgi:site-specific DNA-methyltransferase (cytosine-N4-specific)
MQRGARACFLIGRSVIHGRVIDNVALLVRASAPHGFVLQDVIERRIPATRKAFNPAHGKINAEHIVLLKLRNGT